MKLFDIRRRFKKPERRPVIIADVVVEGEGIDDLPPELVASAVLQLIMSEVMQDEQLKGNSNM